MVAVARRFLLPCAAPSRDAGRQGLSRDRGEDVNLAVCRVKFDDAIREGEEGVVASNADIRPGTETGAALADENVARDDRLAAEFFHAEALADAVAPVAYAALTFFMRQSGSPIRLKSW